MFLRFWSPKGIQNEGLGPLWSNFLQWGGKCVFERPYMDLAWFSVSGGVAERQISWKKHMLPKSPLKVCTKSIFYWFLVEIWEPIKGSKRYMAVSGRIFFVTFSASVAKGRQETPQGSPWTQKTRECVRQIQPLSENHCNMLAILKINQPNVWVKKYI